MSRESGHAALELTLGVALLVVPVLLLVAMLPVWLEQRSVAALAAREAARAYVLAADTRAAQTSAQAVATRIAEQHGVEPGDFSIRVVGRLRRGAGVVATARVRVPAAWLPGLGRIGGFTISVGHREIVDPYRSL